MPPDNHLHLRDTDGDGKADVRDILFEGFDRNSTSAIPISISMAGSATPTDSTTVPSQLTLR